MCFTNILTKWLSMALTRLTHSSFILLGLTRYHIYRDTYSKHWTQFHYLWTPWIQNCSTSLIFLYNINQIMITTALVCAFILCYYSNEDPPIYDIISPLITITIIVNVLTTALPTSLPILLLLVGLGLESIADFYMNKDSLGLSIGLFSISHLIRQFSLLRINFIILMLRNVDLSAPDLDIVVIIISAITTIFTVLLLERLHAMQPGSSVSFLVIGYYSTIIFLSAVQVSMVQGAISYGYVIFIISDLIVGYDLIIRKISPRWLRIITVPVLYWTAQYLLTLECLFNI